MSRPLFSYSFYLRVMYLRSSSSRFFFRVLRTLDGQIFLVPALPSESLKHSKIAFLILSISSPNELDLRQSAITPVTRLRASDTLAATSLATIRFRNNITKIRCCTTRKKKRKFCCSWGVLLGYANDTWLSSGYFWTLADIFHTHTHILFTPSNRSNAIE